MKIGIRNQLPENKGNPAMAEYIKERSRKMARTREQVEEEILGREFKIMQEEEDDLPLTYEEIE